MFEQFFNKVNNNNKINEEPVVNLHKECWNQLKDRLINLYSEMSIETAIKNQELTNDDIVLLAKWNMLSDIVNIMNQIERNNIK